MNSMSDAYVSCLGGALVEDEASIRASLPAGDKAHDEESADNCLIPRRSGIVPLVLESIVHVPVVMCAEDGMGKTSTIYSVIEQLDAQGYASKYEDLASLGPESANARLREVLRWAKRVMKEGRRVLVALDNLRVGDESDVEMLVRTIRRVTRQGAIIIIATAPEGELLVESLSEARCFWSCDMCVDVHVKSINTRRMDYLTHGIPRLVNAVARNPADICERMLGDPGYQEAYAETLKSCLRSELIEDERMMRVCMVMLGTGGITELREMLGNVDADLWRMTARDAPFFGVDVLRGSFSCAGTRSADDINACFPLLSDYVLDWPALASCAARLLAGRGEYVRAAAVSLLCSDADERRLIAYEWAPEFMNVGEVSVVSDAVNDIRMPVTAVQNSAIHLLEAFKGGRGPRPTHPQRGMLLPEEESREGTLALWCYGLSRGEGLHTSFAKEEDDSALSQALVLHGTALVLVSQGRLTAAHRLLLESDVRHGNKTLSASLVESDYVLCSLLVGMRPSRADVSAFGDAGRFFHQCGLGKLNALHKVIMPLGALLLGRELPSEELEVHMRGASAGGQELLKGMFLLACAVGDMRGGSLTLGHVRLERAAKAFDDMGLKVLGAISSILDVAIRLQLGDKVPRSELDPYRGMSEGLDLVIGYFEVAAYAQAGQSLSTSQRAERQTCPRDVLWLVNVLANDCGGFSKRFKGVMPDSWEASINRAAKEVSLRMDEGLANGSSAETHAHADGLRVPRTQPETEDPIVEIYMLGGFEIRVGGVPLLGRRLESRRAKSMLALLAAVPGHVAKRFTLMESVWPEHDYETAKKCVYSATSKIRAEIQPGYDVEEWPQIVVSNKAAGTVLLNGAIVSCDVDALEEKARKALDSEGNHRRVVSLCRKVEDLYRGDLYVPPNDGAGVVGRRSRELKELYGDAMVAGSAAAGALDMKLLACRFARKAYTSDNLREDAVRALVLALCALGRQIEAMRCYEDYASRVITMARRPPSRGLRELVERLVSGAAADESREGERKRSGGRRTRVEILDSKAVELSGQLSFDFDEAKSA